MKRGQNKLVSWSQYSAKAQSAWLVQGVPGMWVFDVVLVVVLVVLVSVVNPPVEEPMDTEASPVGVVD